MTEKKENSEFAVIETGGKQYIVEPNTVISVEKLDYTKNSIILENVLLYSKNGQTSFGTPYLNYSVKAEVLADEKDKKIRVFKFKKKTGFKKKQGHRQKHTTIKVLSIVENKKETKEKTIVKDAQEKEVIKTKK